MNISKWNIPLVLKRMVEFLLVVSPVLMIVLPFIFASFNQDVVSKYISSHAQNRWITFTLLEICGVICWLVLLMLQKLLHTVINSSPFVYENVNYLKYISYLCAVATFVLIIKCVVDFSVLTPVIAVLALLASLFCQTLAAVFDKAIRLKNENDLTI